SYSAGVSLYEHLHQQAGQIVTMAKEILRPIVLTPDQAAPLQGQAGELAWLSIRVSFNRDGTPIVYDEAVLRGDRFVITMERLGKRTNCQLNLSDDNLPETLAFLLED
ncbi:MAG: UTRA domain-containing protein, partial [Chloroflexota bacterium]